MKQPDKVEELIEQNMGLVYYVLRKHYPSFLGDEDVVQEARIGLWKACISYNSSKGSFSSYAVVCIINNIRMYLRKNESYSTRVSVSLDAPVDDEQNTAFRDFIEDRCGCVEDSGVFLKDFISRLDEREKQIIRLQLLSVKQIGACKHVGVTQAWYSRLLKRIYKKWEAYGKGRVHIS